MGGWLSRKNTWCTSKRTWIQNPRPAEKSERTTGLKSQCWGGRTRYFLEFAGCQSWKLQIHWETLSQTKVDNNRGRQPPLTSDLGTGVSGYANLDTDVHTKRHTPIHLSNISQDTIAEKFSNSIKYSIIDIRKYQVGKNKTQKSHSHTSYSNLKTYSPKDIYRERTQGHPPPRNVAGM